MVTEIELKYSLLESVEQVKPEQVKAIISQLLSEHEITFAFQEKQLSNHYFDTADFTLRKNKIALRTRGTQCNDEAKQFEQTIKTSGTVIAGLHQRPEYNIDIVDAKPIISLFPDNIFQPSIEINLLQQQIVELFSTHFTRYTWLVSSAGTQVEIAFDCGDVACQDYANKPRIYEVELELVTGDANALLMLTKLLFSKLALRPGQLTKAARGYALYHESIASTVDVESQPANDIEVAEQLSLPIIEIPKKATLQSAFTHGIEFSLNELQLCVDRYVETPSLNVLSKISEQLVLLRQGFWLFDELLTPNEKTIRSELSYFIRTIHWAENASYIHSLINKQSSYQKENQINHELITKLQLRQSRYPKESQVLALLHSERFNHLQIDLLSLLLKRSTADNLKADQKNSLAEFARSHLTSSTKQLSDELFRAKKTESVNSIGLYLTSHSLLIRALLTTSWFSCLFVEAESEVVNRFNMPWLDIKQGISELQSLNLLQQQLMHLPKHENKLTQWLTTKSENLIAALDQSTAKALTMKPYWS